MNITDSYGRTPLLIAAANGHSQLVRILLANGGDVSIPATYQSSHNVNASGGYRYNAISLAATGSIRGMLERSLLRWLNTSDLEQFQNNRSSSDIGALLNSLSEESSMGMKRLSKAHSSFKMKNMAIGEGIGLALNEAYLHSGSEDIQYFDSESALSAKSQLVLGMKDHLTMLSSKNWAYRYVTPLFSVFCFLSWLHLP